MPVRREAFQGFAALRRHPLLAPHCELNTDSTCIKVVLRHFAEFATVRNFEIVPYHATGKAAVSYYSYVQESCWKTWKGRERGH